jgi:hypothetical protein
LKEAASGTLRLADDGELAGVSLEPKRRGRPPGSKSKPILQALEA